MQKQEVVHTVHVPRVLQPGEGHGVTAKGIVILHPVHGHPPVLLPALLQLRHVHHPERGDIMNTEYSQVFQISCKIVHYLFSGVK